jgi:CRP/FNR family transcriptional regulator, cyclic AMP receptor protein
MAGVSPELLRRIPLFGALEDAALAAIAGAASMRSYQPHAVVVRQDEPSDGVYLITAGRLSVSVSGSDGRVTTIGHMGPGEIIGEISLLDGGARSATVVSETKSVLVAVDRSLFLPLVQAHPAIAMALVSVVSARLRALTRWADETVGLSVPARLARRLLALLAECGQPTGPQRHRIGLRLSQGELGNRVGATRESVNKYLRRWERGHILEQEAGYLVIVDLPRLKAIAEDF